MMLRYVGVFFFQAEDGIRDLVRSRGLGDVYKRQGSVLRLARAAPEAGEARADHTCLADLALSNSLHLLSLIHI